MKWIFFNKPQPKQVFIVPHYTVRPIDRKAKRNAKCMELAAELGAEWVAKVSKLREVK